MSDTLESTFVRELEINDESREDVSRLYYKRFHAGTAEHDDEWTMIEVEDLADIDEDLLDRAIAYTPRNIYTAAPAHGGTAELQFVVAPRHVEVLE